MQLKLKPVLVNSLLIVSVETRTNFSWMFLLVLESDVAMVMRKQSSRKFSSKPLSANIQNEHGLVGQLLIEVIGPRFSAEVLSTALWSSWSTGFRHSLVFHGWLNSVDLLVFHGWLNSVNLMVLTYIVHCIQLLSGLSWYTTFSHSVVFHGSLQFSQGLVFYSSLLCDVMLCIHL